MHEETQRGILVESGAGNGTRASGQPQKTLAVKIPRMHLWRKLGRKKGNDQASKSGTSF